jgi:hypothetical protein
MNRIIKNTIIAVGFSQTQPFDIYFDSSEHLWYPHQTTMKIIFGDTVDVGFYLFFQCLLK